MIHNRRHNVKVTSMTLLYTSDNSNIYIYNNVLAIIYIMPTSTMLNNTIHSLMVATSIAVETPLFKINVAVKDASYNSKPVEYIVFRHQMSLRVVTNSKLRYNEPGTRGHNKCIIISRRISPTGKCGIMFNVSTNRMCSLSLTSVLNLSVSDK